MIEIKCRFTGEILFSHEGPTIKIAVEAAVEARANLADANLAHANLADANLAGANLAGANLAGANLAHADLARANLADANLAGANLAGANLAHANLAHANLADANLARANLADANLAHANLADANLADTTILPTGESWLDYLTDVVPALLTAGGKALESFVEPWTCHSWENCPMHHAFDAPDLNGVPPLLRPRAAQFVTLFDAGLIPCPVNPGQPSEAGAK